MRRPLPLFWRMYLGFLLALFLPLGLFELSSFGARQRWRGEMVQGLPRLLAWTVTSLGEEAARVRREGGDGALTVFLRREGERRGMDLTLLRSDGSALPPLFPGALRPDGPEDPLPGGGRVLRLEGHRLGVAVPLPGGEDRLLGVLRSPGPPGGGEGRPPRPPRPPGPLEVLFLPMLVGATLCFLLMRWISSPLRDLRRATAALAEGDLSARVGPKVTDRGDEIAALGRAFNGMAERIQSLLRSQQRLLGDISHELRSPLQRVGLAAALAREGCTPEGTAFLDRVDRETERMNGLIGQLLELTREELADRREEGPLVLRDLLERIASDGSFEGAREGKRVEVLPGDSWVLEVEEAPLARALENGVRNALRHTPPGTSVELGAEARGEDLAVFVRDHGPGVAEEDRERIFLPFFRVDPARDRKTGGVGLGLAIARESVRRLGGTVRARNHPEGGLVLEILLPRGGDQAPSS